MKDNESAMIWGLHPEMEAPGCRVCTDMSISGRVVGISRVGKQSVS